MPAFGPWGLWGAAWGPFPAPPGAEGAMPKGSFPCAAGGTSCPGCWSCFGAAPLPPAYLAALAHATGAGFCGLPGLADMPTAASGGQSRCSAIGGQPRRTHAGSCDEEGTASSMEGAAGHVAFQQGFGPQQQWQQQHQQPPPAEQWQQQPWQQQQQQQQEPPPPAQQEPPPPAQQWQQQQQEPPSPAQQQSWQQQPPPPPPPVQQWRQEQQPAALPAEQLHRLQWQQPDWQQQPPPPSPARQWQQQPWQQQERQQPQQQRSPVPPLQRKRGGTAVPCTRTLEAEPLPGA